MAIVLKSWKILEQKNIYETVIKQSSFLEQLLCKLVDANCSREETKLIWQKHYPHDPFDLIGDNEINSYIEIFEFPEEISIFKYDIVKAALRQKNFFYQVSI